MVKKFLPAWPKATRVRIFLPSREIRIFSITWGKNFILTRPLGKELYILMKLIDRALGVRICVIYVKLNQTCKNFCENEAGVIEFYSFTLGTRERNSIYSITPASISRKIQTKSYIFSVKSTQEVQMPFVPLHSVDKFLIIRSCSK